MLYRYTECEENPWLVSDVTENASSFSVYVGCGLAVSCFCYVEVYPISQDFYHEGDWILSKTFFSASDDMTM